jgi:hypothetical protein
MTQSTHVMRENEQRRPIRFDSEEAEAAFNARATDKTARDEARRTGFFAVPFLLLYSREHVLSDAAWYNDQITACDANSDGLITFQEALAYNRKYVDEAAKVAAMKPGANGPTGSSQPASFQQPLDPPMPEQAWAPP